MKNKVGFFNETDEEIKELEEIKKLIEYALKREKLENVEFNIVIVDNATIHKLNNEYRGVDSPTDVLSFALEDNLDIKLPGIRLLGDIYISLDKLKEQAKEYGHSFLRELAFLTIHGFLHLLGYNHMDQKEEEIMFKKQELILDGYGIKK
ncbi:MAG: rRNA maturation RNase YbeY [Mollicutes bacterium]|nr:rRNA maturation RNase YbeY [Mollicutes bacterium]